MDMTKYNPDELNNSNELWARRTGSEFPLSNYILLAHETYLYLLLPSIRR